MGKWDANQYLKFENQRTLPAIDLANRIKDLAPATVLDIGCGPGNSTNIVKKAFPDADVIGIDSSQDMIEKAKLNYPDITFKLLDANSLTERYDVIFSNACLQWIPDHAHLIPYLIKDHLNDGGVIAVQIPMNGEEPLFRIIREAPGFGDNQKDQLSDIATLTGATVISKDLGMQLKDMTMEDLGTCKKLIVEKDATTLIEGAGSKEAFKERISELESMLEKTTSDYDKKKLHERIAKLSNGVAVIKVGATTEAEMKDKKLRLEDALNATRAAIEEGIIIGGGACLANVSNEVRAELRSDVVDVQKGINIVLDSLTAPLYQIAENAGYDGDEIVKKQLAEKENVGFDAKNGKWVDMFEEGIVDPCKVTRSALLNAASVSGLLITTEAAVGTIKEKEPAMPAGGGMGMY